MQLRSTICKDNTARIVFVLNVSFRRVCGVCFSDVCPVMGVLTHMILTPFLCDCLPNLWLRVHDRLLIDKWQIIGK